MDFDAMDSDAHKVFFAIGTCHRLMKAHASDLRLRGNVRNVTHWFDMYNVEDGFRMEEYVDAELTNGQAMSWRLELTLTKDDYAVESDIRLNHDQGQDVLVEIADCTYLTATDCSTGILEIVRRLCSTNPV